MKKWVKSKIEKWNMKICKWMIVFVAKHNRPMLQGIIMEKASELSVGMMMNMFDREGIRHCFRCPQRFGLRKRGLNLYACNNHMNIPVVNHDEKELRKSA